MRLMLAASGVPIKLRMCRHISVLFYKENETDCACLAIEVVPFSWYVLPHLTVTIHRV